ncbi:MAG: alpha-amlyase [Bacteroidetes bacterium]|nr:alpha-amlyase [Bacteroidota bacterium]
MEKVGKLFLQINLILCLGLECIAQKNFKIEHIEPMNWWVGMKHSQIQLLLHGDNISRFSVESPSFPISDITKTENPNYLFVTIETKDRNSGKYQIRLVDKKKVVATIDYELKERQYGSANRKGFTSEDVVYLLMPDRFANLYPGGDTHPETAEKADRSNPNGRHGGDIHGIIQHLDYIKELGATTIWTTPLLEDNEETYSYHGYAQSNLYKCDPRYGSIYDFQFLVQEAHRNGLKVIKDEVPNHWSSKHWMLKDLPSQTWIHQFPSFTRSNYRTSTQMDPYRSEKDKRSSEDGWFDTSMPDLNQANPLVLNYLIQNTIWWVEFAELDGLRVDTYSYNDKEAIAKWTKVIMEEYPNFNMVGEVWMHDQAQISYWQKDSPIGSLQSYNSNLPAVMDFTLHDAFLEAFKESEQGWDKGMVRFYENFVNDFLYKDPANLLIFFENHDTQRFNEYCPDIEDYKLATTLLATTRGIPQIYYGSEIGMKGDKGKGDADIRRDFPGGWPGDTNNVFTEKGRTTEQKAYFDFSKKIWNWRKGKSVIHTGSFTQFLPQNNVYVYFRYNESETVMVVINNSKEAQLIDLSRFRNSLKNYKRGLDVISGNMIQLEEPLAIDSKKSLILELK